MTQDTQKTTVVFRKEKDGDIVAVFPYDIADWRGSMTCYSHVGQHSSMRVDYYKDTSPAYPMQYERLLKELESIGYNLEIKTRVQWSRVHDALNSII